MARRKKTRSSVPRCAHCDKDAGDPHYYNEVKPGTDPSLVHRVYDANLRFISIYHYCGHYTVYVGRPEELTGTT